PPCGQGMGAPGLTLYVNITDSVDELCERARASGVSVTQEPRDEFWGDRMFVVEHPDGYRFSFANHVRDVSEEEMKQAMEQWAAAAPGGGLAAGGGARAGCPAGGPRPPAGGADRPWARPPGGRAAHGDRPLRGAGRGTRGRRSDRPLRRGAGD